MEKHLQRSGDEELLGTHTYNVCSDYEVVDYSIMDKIPAWVMLLHDCYAVWNRIKRVRQINIGDVKMSIRRLLYDKARKVKRIIWGKLGKSVIYNVNNSTFPPV